MLLFVVVVVFILAVFWLVFPFTGAAVTVVDVFLVCKEWEEELSENDERPASLKLLALSSLASSNSSAKEWVLMGVLCISV